MDPDAQLQQILHRAKTVAEDPTDADNAAQLAHAVSELDGWLSRGGWKPERWSGRGVNLALDDTQEQLFAAIDQIRNRFLNKHVVLPSRTAQIVVGIPIVGTGTPGEEIVAALATHVEVAAGPIEAVRRLDAMLEEDLRKIGSG